MITNPRSSAELVELEVHALAIANGGYTEVSRQSLVLSSALQWRVFQTAFNMLCRRKIAVGHEAAAVLERSIFPMSLWSRWYLSLGAPLLAVAEKVYRHTHKYTDQYQPSLRGLLKWNWNYASKPTWQDLEWAVTILGLQFDNLCSSLQSNRFTRMEMW